MNRIVYIAMAAPLSSLLPSGCGGDTPAISLDGRTVALSEIIFEHDRLNGAGQWERASAEQRRAFVDTYARKELLLREARELFGDELRPADEAAYQRYRHRRAARLYTEGLQAGVAPSAAEIDSVIELMKHQRRVTDISCKDEADAREIQRRVQAGEDFLAIGRELADRRPGMVMITERGWTSRPLVPPRIGDLIFGIGGLGQVTEPFYHPSFDWLMIRLEELRGALVDWDTVEKARFVTELKQRAAFDGHSRRVEAKYAFQLVEEHLAPVERAFLVRRDPVASGQAEVPEGEKPASTPPLQRFSAEELELPLVRWSGGTWTIGDYVRSLELADPPFWPTTETGAKIGDQVLSRMMNWAWVQEALASDVVKTPQGLAETRRERERLLMDRFYEERLKQFGEGITDEQMISFWNEHRRDYYKPERVVYDFIRFPPGRRNLADRGYEMLEQGGSWSHVGAQMQAADRRVLYAQEIGPTSGPPYPELTAVALEHDVLDDGSPRLLRPIEIDGDWVLLRILARARLEAVDFDMAEPFVRRDLERFAMEESLVGLLEQLAGKYNLKVAYDRLGARG